MAATYQEINEILASLKDTTETKKADRFLTEGVGDKPEWLDAFFDSNKRKLNETIIRAISSRAGMTSLSGYSEGYFNEIIQNANDLHAGDCIDIELGKNGTVYSVKCVYQDKGFILSNIYALLNREMSDKSSEKGQTGKFGVGIKSFFKFVNRFRIESNVIFDFKIDRTTNQVTDSTVSVNDSWNKENTVLYFEYTREENTGFNFNTRKLSDLIEYFDGNGDGEILEFFFDGEDKKMVFDIRSLIFMNLNPLEKNISKINFSGRCHNVSVICENNYELQSFEYEKQKWEITNILLCVLLDGSTYKRHKYVTFTHSGTSLCFPVSIELGGEYNRIYSTYYIKSDDQCNIFPLGMLVNTSSANLHRNDLADNEKSIKKAYKKIKDVFIDMLWFMCSPEIKDSYCIDDISDIFHSILLIYLDVDKDQYDESPFNQNGLDNQYLPKISDNPKTDIVFHRSEENYQKYSFRDQSSVSELTETYFRVIEKDNVIDYNEVVDSGIYGVSKLYEKIKNYYGNNDNYALAVSTLHYYSSVADYISYVISGEHRDKPSLYDNEIDEWLYKLKNDLKENYNQELLLKLIGRYELNSAIAFDGSLRKEKLSFRDYLFNGLPELKDGTLTNWQNEMYDHKYEEMKRQVTGNRVIDPGNQSSPFKIRYIEPKGPSRRRWDEMYDCYGQNIIQCDVSEKNKFILLDKIAADSNLIRMIKPYNMWLYEKKVISMRCRDKYFEHYFPEREQQILCLDYLRKINLKDFGDFLHAVNCRKIIKANNPSIGISIKCDQSSVTTYNIISDFLPYLVGMHDETSKTACLRNEYNEKDVLIYKIEENTTNELPEENRRFIFKLSGYNVHLNHFNSGSKKYMISYFGNKTAAIKTSAKDSFKPIATYNSSDENVYIFYDNVPEPQEVVAEVLKNMNISKNLMELLVGYIHNGNGTKTMNYLARRRTFARIRKSLEWDWSDISTDNVHVSENTEVMYRLLTARGSYDIYCPICSDIPLETFNYGEDTKNKHSRKIIVMENENKDTNSEFPYIITVGCSYCFEKLRNTLSKSEFDGKSITLTTQIAQGQHERMRSRHQIKLSPVNIQIMKNFKFGK